ncbi:MAG TPA: DUF2235 domain-containing protein [Nocardioidaceae bacterium]|jgi:hypothetical protein
MTEEHSPQRAAKRLVICCDGTWNAPDNANITNIEKIARSIETNAANSGGVQQLVEYVQGVGVGYKTDRLLGGAFGFGLFNNVRTAYRFLALNYEVGDEIFIFGFSRGAYTARSLAGMVGYVGLLTGDALVRGQLRRALDLYKNRDTAQDTASKAELKRFHEENCHDVTPITFIGVFDTVGALGVPGSVLFPEHQFHDIDLGNHVLCARHAVAIDERRMTFAPCLWTVPADQNGTVTFRSGTPTEQTVDRVKQVWFEGVHSDVGGGYPENGLSCTTLLWMADEAKAAGLVFDEHRLGFYVDRAKKPVRNNSLTFWFRIVNIRERMRPRRGVDRRAFVNGLRSLEPPVVPLKDHPERTMVLPGRVSSTAWTAFDDAAEAYRPANLAAFITGHTPPKIGETSESVILLPREVVAAPSSSDGSPDAVDDSAGPPEGSSAEVAVPQPRVGDPESDVAYRR